MFKQLSSTSVSRSAKRRHSHAKRTFSDTEYPKVTANIVSSSTTPSKTKRKQLIVSSDEFDTEPEGVYQHTCTWTGTIALVDYNALSRGIEVSEVHSAIAESQALNSSVEKEAFTYMTGTPEKMASDLNNKPKSRESNSI